MSEGTPDTKLQARAKCAAAAAAVLDSRDQENLVRAIEFSLPIRRRSQFFLWSQGILQALIPHELLLCAYGSPSGGSCITVRHSTRPLPQAAYEEMCSPTHGLLMMSHAQWERTANAPLLVCGERRPSWLAARLGALLERHDLGSCAAHGLPALDSAAGSFFFFARMPGPLHLRHAYLLELILPYLHVAYLRTLIHDPQSEATRPGGLAQNAAASLSRAVTARQIQILQWLHEGKSNREIGQILDISPYTVKNHVQNILKKLDVRNRTQAVSYALAARLIDSSRAGAEASPLEEGKP